MAILTLFLFIISYFFYTVKWLNSSIWPLDGTITGIAKPDQRGTWNNSNEREIIVIQQFPRLPDWSHTIKCSLMSYPSKFSSLEGSYRSPERCSRRILQLRPTGLYHIYLIIHHPQHHHDVVLLARIPVTPSRHSSLSPIASGRSFRPHRVSAQSYYW